MPIVSKCVHVSNDSKLSKLPETVVLLRKMQLESIHGSQSCYGTLSSLRRLHHASRTSRKGSQSLPRHGCPLPSALAFHYAFALECISFSSLKVHTPNK